jgi:dipeptidyl aminopeptidase/acylaminoacyl peptidase
MKKLIFFTTPVLMSLLIVLVLITIINMYPWILNPWTIAVQAHGGRYDEGIYLFDIRHKEFTRLTPEDILAHKLSWSPGGEQIAYVYQKIGLETGISILEIVKNESKTAIVTSQTDDVVIEPYSTMLAWSPDSRSILYSAYQLEYQYLFLVDLSSGQSQRLPFDFSSKERLQFAWSPSGNIAIARDEQIYLADLETGEMTFLTNGAIPFWAHDGQHLTYICSPNNKRAICKIGLNDRTQEVIYQPERWRLVADAGIQWSPEERFIICFEGGGESDPSYITILDMKTGLVHHVYQNYWLSDTIVEYVALSPK